MMTTNLLQDEWVELNSAELRILLDKRIGGPGQFRDRSDNPNQFCLPLSGPTCRVYLTFRDNKIVAVEPGPAFDQGEWGQICKEIESSVLAGPIRVGREYSFSSFRVNGWWRGEQSGVQILPPPPDAPIAPVEISANPFILEFRMNASELWSITNHRRAREHRRLTHLLNVLLVGRTRLQPRRSEHFWAAVPRDDNNRQRSLINWIRRLFSNKNNARYQPEIKWVQQFYFAKLGKVVTDDFTSPEGTQLDELDPDIYYTNVGHDEKGMRVPSDLDHSIGLYRRLTSTQRAKFDRAAFWMDMASRQWNMSVSSSFASLVSAVESLTERGTTHRLYCEQCGEHHNHESPGATERFREFFEKYAPGESARPRRSKMYSLRSGILHGSDLMQLDQDLARMSHWGESLMVSRGIEGAAGRLEEMAAVERLLGGPVFGNRRPKSAFQAASAQNLSGDGRPS